MFKRIKAFFDRVFAGDCEDDELDVVFTPDPEFEAAINEDE